MEGGSIRNRDGSLGVQIDAESGLLTGVLVRQQGAEISLPLELSATLVTGGEEVFAPPRSLGYTNITESSSFRRVGGLSPRCINGPEETHTIATEVDGWAVHWHYTFRQSHPRLGISLDLSSNDSRTGGTLRDLRLDLTARLPELETWRVEVPGNQLRPGVAAGTLLEPVAVSPVGGVRGSTGLVSLHRPDPRQVLILWPFSRVEIGEIDLQSEGDAIRLRIDTGLAGRITGQESLRYGSLHLDVLEGTWKVVRDDIPAWYAPLGLSTPQDKPDWIGSASIFEVQIGYSVFWEGYRYEPYPTVRDLLEDLGRIRVLGYDVLQIMPRQPYPGYNVHDYADITTSYGDEGDLRKLVAACHALGMRVILDILLHGVIDCEVALWPLLLPARRGH